MTLDGEYDAVVDRIEGDQAVLEVDADGELRELVVDVEELPPVARTADATLDVTVQGGKLVDATYQRRATRRRKRNAQDRFDRLSRRPPRDDDEQTE